MARGPIAASIRVDGVDQLARAMTKAPPEVRRELTKAMRRAAIPAQARASAVVHWSGPVRIRARNAGAAVGTEKVHPPIIEFGNKAVIGPGGKVAPHVRKLTRKPALIDAVESTVAEARDIADRELAQLLDRILAQEGVLRHGG